MGGLSYFGLCAKLFLEYVFVGKEYFKNRNTGGRRKKKSTTQIACGRFELSLNT